MKFKIFFYSTLLVSNLVSMEQNEQYDNRDCANDNSSLATYFFQIINNHADNKLKNNEKLLKAAQQNNLSLMQQAIDSGVYIDIKSAEGNTPLIWAALNGNKEMVEKLINYKANVNAQNLNGETALICAHKNGYQKLVRILLDHGARVSNKCLNIPESFSLHFGFQPNELLSDNAKLKLYLHRIRALATLLIIYKELYILTFKIHKPTIEMTQCLNNNFCYLHAGFGYIDKKQLIVTESQKKSDKYILTSSEAKAALLQAQNLLRVENLSFSDINKINNPDARINSTSSKIKVFIKELLANDNRELIIIGTWLKFSLANKIRSKLLNEFIKFYKLYLECKKTILAFPCSIEMRKFITCILDLIDSSNPIIDFAFVEFRDYKLQNKFVEQINIVLDSFAKNKNTLETFYSALREELFSYFNNSKNEMEQDLRKEYEKPLFQVLDNQSSFPKYLSITLAQVDPEDNQWIADAKKIVELKKKAERIDHEKQTSKKLAKKNSKKKKVQKAKYNTKDKEKEKEYITEDAVQNSTIKTNDLISKILYDSRITQWFDKEFIEKENPDKRSILYHTFPLIADHFIFKYGIPKEWNNRIHKGQIDTVYYMGGEIIYKKGKQKRQRETVLFVCCKDPKGICYHRGFEKKQESLFKEFEANEYNYNFPPICSEAMLEEKTIEINFNDKKYYRENNFFIEIDDPQNNVMLILYKPNFEG